MDNFYITLPSTSTTGNTQSSFITHLAQPINLTGDWEVGLAESHVYHAWNNIDNSNNSFSVEYVGDIDTGIKLEYFLYVVPGIYTSTKEIADSLSTTTLLDEVKIQYIGENIMVEVGREWEVSLVGEFANIFTLSSENTYVTQSKKITEPISLDNLSYFRLLHKTKTLKKPIRVLESLRIPIGWYENASELFEAINGALPKNQRHQLNLTLNADDTVTMEAGIKVKFHEGLRDMMGFTSNKMLTGKVTGKYPIELNRGVYGIYVYSDIVFPQLVGNSYAPLLRVLPVGHNSSSRRKQKLIVQIYDNPDYLPLSRNSFESIEIYLRSESGDPLVFRAGKTLMKLHFRRAKK